MAELFATTPENVLMRRQNVLEDGELEGPATTEDFQAVHQKVKREREGTIQNFRIVRQEGNGGSGDSPCTINASNPSSNDVNNRAF